MNAFVWAPMLVFLGAGAAGQTVFEVAVSRELPEGAPKASDVIMRSLRARPANAKDPYDTLKALRDFHVTRLEWAYIDNAAFVAKVKAMGRLFGGAAAAPSYRKASNDPVWFEKVVVVNLDGEPIIAPWKRSWSRTLWGCINNPELERGYLEYLKRYIDAGAQVMQRDEPRANQSATHWGGCFCPHCMAKFRAWLAEHTSEDTRRELGIADLATFDYREHLKAQGAPVGDAFRKWDGGKLKGFFIEFQTEATVAFHERTRAAINEYAGRRVPFSCNNGARSWGEIELGFDWTFGELSYGHARPTHLCTLMRQAATLGRCQVVTMPKATKWQDRPDLVQRTRKAIAMTYACGGHCMVPWDTYMPGDAPRYFGAPDQFADLFAFVRATARYLDGYEEAAVFGKGIEETRYGDAPPVRILDNEGAYAVVRVTPDRADLPVVVHLIDWSDASTPFTVQLTPSRLYAGASLVARLLTPMPYAQADHEAAEENGAFDKLAQSVAVPVADGGRVAIPSLNPWAILLLTQE